MEIYFREVDLGVLKVEVSVRDNSNNKIYSLKIDDNNFQSPFYVYLTARDAESRKIWETPMMTDDGQLKSYNSITEALEDVGKKVSSVSVPLSK